MIIVLTTVDEKNAKELAKKILEKRLAACINILDSSSLYWWENEIKEEKEKILLIKTRDELYDELEAFIKQNHPYQLPEIIAIKVEDGYSEYLRWVDKETSIKRRLA